ncbi:FOG: WD40 repeat [Hahella chejuensis KCTC 2396]|uniref:FOG: WD40 repeat n=1 Tax=Hahella chejuensis (strain KCTC 2396) TaxID=349521 RepID=Q2SI09_HAHCH|nr:hypothetical protein [Hahella chejuensis]ABC29715.1 FOG: WD40 repeat [Hahella chejuensis KCTC 2396]
MKHFHLITPARRKPVLSGTLLVLSSLLSACGGGGSSSDDKHTDTDIDAAGRLAIYDADAQALKVLDLNDGSVLESFTLIGSAPRLYPLPGDRYTAVLQRDDNKVSFIDGGLYTEDHGDHMHDYAEAPRLLDFTLSGVRPTHYVMGESSAIVFNDGDDMNVASVTALSGASVAAGEVLLELNRENNMHGVAKLIDGHLFVTYRDSGITDTTLPAEVERYSIADGIATFEERYDAQCPRLHGAGYNQDVLIFGCADGLLAIDLHNADYPAIKYGNPESLADGSRIGTVYGHKEVATLVTSAGSQLFATVIENGAVSYQELKLDEGVSGLSQNFTPNGEFFWVLGDNEKLYLWETDGDWAVATSFSVSSTDIESAYVASSTVNHMLYVLDVENRRIVEVDYEAGLSGRTFALDFTPSGLSWMGLAGHEDDEDHSHD